MQPGFVDVHVPDDTHITLRLWDRPHPSDRPEARFDPPRVPANFLAEVRFMFHSAVADVW